MLRFLLVLFAILALTPSICCQTYTGGMTLPSPQYLQHPPVCFPASPPTALKKGGTDLAIQPPQFVPVKYEQPMLLPAEYDPNVDPLMPKIPDMPKKRSWRERLGNLFSRTETAELQHHEPLQPARTPVENPFGGLPPQTIPPQGILLPAPAPLQQIPMLEYPAPKLTPPSRNGTWNRQTEGMLTTLKIEANRIHLCIHSAYRDEDATADTRYHVELVADAATGPDGRVFGVFTNVECQGLSVLPTAERENIMKALNAVIDEPFSFRTRQDDNALVISDVKGKMFQVFLVELNINGLQCMQGKYTSGNNKPLPEVKATPRKKEKPNIIQSIR